MDLAASEQDAPPSVNMVAPLTFAAVYDEHADFVWRIVARLGVARASVPDVVQEVFVVVHRKLDDFQGASSVRTWLFQIARRAVQEHRRTARRKDTPDASGEGALDVDRVPAAEGSSPEAAAARTQAVRLVHAILAEMDDEKLKSVRPVWRSPRKKSDVAPQAILASAFRFARPTLAAQNF